MSDSARIAPSSAAANAPARRNHPLRGIACLSVSVFAFSVHDVCMKWVSGGYPLSEVLFIRSATAAPLLLMLVHLEAGLGALATRQLGLVLLRAATLLAGYYVYYMGLSALPLADAVALYSSVPLIIVALSGPFLGEKVGVLRWLAVAVGFAGVIIMLRPGQGVFEPAGLFILGCALLYSFAMIMGRRLGATVPATVMTFFSNGLFLLSAAGIGLVFNALHLRPVGHPSIDFVLREWSWPPRHELLLMISCGATAAIGIAGLTAAYREAEANLVASFEYTALVWAVLWGYLVWHDVPKPTMLAGAALIVGAGLVALSAGRRRG